MSDTPHASHAGGRLFCLGLFLGLAGCSVSALAQNSPPRVRVALEEGAEEVVVGESFAYQIQVDNVRHATAPDLAAQTDAFSVESGGGNLSSSTSMTFSNGRATRVEKTQYAITYRLTALRPGIFQIPALQVVAAGETLSTEPVTIRVTEPVPVDDYRLVCTLSKDTCYAGEPLIMTTIFYIARDLGSVSFSLPILSSSQFFTEPLPMPRQPDRDYYKIPINGEEVTAERGVTREDGQQFVTLTFKHILVPREPGELNVPDGTVSVEAVTRTRSRRTGPFDSLPFFGSPRDYETVIVPANPLAVVVKPLPEDGKPDNFSGLIGAFDLSASASPTEVNVGDPITLTVALEGSHYLRHFELPSLQNQEALAADFRIPDEMAPGQAEGNRKVFTQTIRAESEDVEVIPPIELSYFDPESGTYKRVSSEPIPLSVRATEVVTAADAEGYQQHVETVEHIAVDEGIAHNFTEPDALEPQLYGPEVWMRSAGSWALLLFPPALYGLLAGAFLFRRFGGARFEGRYRKQARARLEARLATVASEDAVYSISLEALRNYLGARLGLNASALTFADAEPPLRRGGVSDETLNALRDLFAACEAHHYSGGSLSPAATTDFVQRVGACVRDIDRELG